MILHIYMNRLYREWKYSENHSVVWLVDSHAELEWERTEVEWDLILRFKMAGKCLVVFLFAAVVATLLVKPATSDEIAKAKLEVSVWGVFYGRI